MSPATAETAEKAEPMWGEKLYQARARHAVSVLIKLALRSKSLTYTELAAQVGGRPRNMNYVLGSVGKSREFLEQAWGERIPPIEALGVSENTKLPGKGVDHFLTPTERASAAGRAGVVAEIHRRIFEYRKWPLVLRALELAVQNHRAGLPALPARSLARRYWWVNHNKAHRHEIGSEFLWAPKKNHHGASNESYNNMARLSPGDVIVSFASAQIGAVGMVLSGARDSPRPAEFDIDAWNSPDPGWRVAVAFLEIAAPVRPTDHAKRWRGVLPRKLSPLRESGAGNRGVYLAALPDRMVEVVSEILGGQLQAAIARLEETRGDEIKAAAEDAELQQRTDIGPTEKLSLHKARRGQGVYRQNLERIERGCRVAGVTERRFLTASHIKPWSDSTDPERLDGYNGLLLSPHIDRLFDKGWISFSNSGNLLIRDSQARAVLVAWGIGLPLNVGAFKPQQCIYLDCHRRSHGFAGNETSARSNSKRQ